MPSIHEILEESILVASDGGADALVALELGDTDESNIGLVLYIGNGEGDYEETHRERVKSGAELADIIEHAEKILDEQLDGEEG